MIVITGLACITSDRSVSLQRVCKDIIQVFRDSGINDVKMVLSANADPSLYEDVDMAITVMTYDPAWVIPYFFLARDLKIRGKVSLFYTTTEGRVRRTPYDYWVHRDLTFIANSNYTRDKLVEVGARVTSVVYHGVNTKSIRAFEFRAKSLRAFLGFKPDDFVVGYIAGCYMRKGHDIYAKVINEVKSKDKSIKFLVLTSKKCVDYYQGIDNLVLMPDFGKLPDDTIYGLYHVFDLYAQASLSEGFGLPVLEALSAGKPIVHADYAPLNEITTNDVSFRVPVMATDYRREMGAIEYELHYYDPKEFADTIVYAKDEVIKNKDDLKAKCLDRANEFDIHRTYKYFVDVYKHGGMKNE